MRSRITVLIGILTLALSAWAGDPWKDKPFKQWDEKDVRRILDDSPWAKPLLVGAMWRGGGPAEARDTNEKPDSTLTRSSGEEGGPPVAGGGQPATSSAEYAQVQYWVRWASARTFLQARARSAMLKGTPEAEADRIANMPVTDHEILITGQDMTPFAKTDEIALKQTSFLRLRKTKQKLAPTRVEIMRGQNGKNISAIVLHFAMKTESGEPIIARDEKGVDFECRAGPLTLKTTFDPTKMVSSAGPDF